MDDGLGPKSGDRAQHRVPVGHVQRRVVGGDDLVPSSLASEDDVAAELPRRAGDENPHRDVAQALPSATGARSRSGSHQWGLAEYQSIVSAMPSSHPISGSQPSSVRIFVASRT